MASSAPAVEASGIVPELLTTRQAAELCGVGQRTLWRWSRSGMAPRPLKIGTGKQGAVRYSRRAIMEWVAAGCPRMDGGGER
jgi:predicted DNA-binding transcriptional regulator AlpA